MKRLLIFAFLLCSISASASFFQGWGIMAGVTYSRQYWVYPQLDSKIKTKYILRYNAEIFGEFGNHPTFRWVTELQYNMKGAKYDAGSGMVKYKNDYAAWNNYLMIRKELFSIIPYVKIGPRLEYVWKTDQSFNQFHATASAGAGVEFVAFGPVKFLTEFHWVPDLTKSNNANNEIVEISQHAYELRVGLKFAFGGGGESCPPVYK
jgi:hypothetical protein